MTNPSDLNVYEIAIQKIEAAITAAVANGDFDQIDRLSPVAEKLKQQMDQRDGGELPTEAQAILDELERSKSPARMTPTALVQTGQILNGLKATYCLEKYLAGGKYAEVWLAQVQGGLEVRHSTIDAYTRQTSSTISPVKQAALKIARVDLSVQEQDAFRQEVETLYRLQEYENQHGLAQEGGSLVPTVFEYVTFSRRPFFVMTLAEGQPLDEIIRSGDEFKEPEALHIVIQFLKVLESLHEGVQRSYLDFQPRNIFYRKDTQHILVLDWNLLSKPNEKSVPGDLKAAARLLYQLLTKEILTAPVACQALAQPGRAWGRLSLAVQNILARAYDERPELCYQAADAMRQACEAVLQLWRQPRANLIQDIERLAEQLRALAPTSRGGGETAIERDRLARQAADRLSIAQKRDDMREDVNTRLQPYIRQMDDWLMGRGALKTGQDLFRGNSYAKAGQFLNDALAEDPEGPVGMEAHRWLRAVEACQERSHTGASEELRPDKLIPKLEWLQQKQFAAAWQGFDELYRSTGRQALVRLSAEAQARLAYQEALEAYEQRNYSTALQKLDQSEDAFRRIEGAYADSARRQVGDLKELKTRWAAENQVRMQAQVLYGELEQAYHQSNAQGYLALKTCLAQQPDSQPLYDFAQGKAKNLLLQGAFSDGRTLMALVLNYAPPEVPRHNLLNLYQTADQLIQVEQDWLRSDWLQLENRLTTLQQLWAETSPQPLLEWLTRWIDAALKTHNYRAALFAASLADKIAPPNERTQMQVVRSALAMDLRSLASWLKENFAAYQQVIQDAWTVPTAPTIYTRVLTRTTLEILLENQDYALAGQMAQSLSGLLGVNDEMMLLLSYCTCARRLDDQFNQPELDAGQLAKTVDEARRLFAQLPQN